MLWLIQTREIMKMHWLLLRLTILLATLSRCSVYGQTSSGCLINRAGLNYVGTQVVTKSLKTCVSWSLTPFATSDALFPEKSVALANNYCRNPGYSKSAIWCYTNATSLEFDYCETVPICQTTCRQTEAGQEYNGATNKDRNGTSCLSWASVNLIGSEYFLYDRSLSDANAYCRNVPPNVTVPYQLNSEPWCFVTFNASSVMRSSCSIQFCSQLSVSGCRTDKLGLLYRGTVSISVSGRSCQLWNSTGVYTAANWPVSGETIEAAGSSCRNPNNSTVGLWCFVSATQWEPCMVQVCEPKTSCPSATQDYYRYRLNQTKSGCQSWSSAYSASAASWYSFTQLPPGSSAVLNPPLFHPAHLPDASLTAAASYCRNPDDDPTGPWCPSPSGGKLYCSDPCNTVTCKSTHKTQNYIGVISVTRRGTTCQKWLARFPWFHTFDTTGDFPDLSLAAAENFCRNPNGNPFGPWCIKAGNFTDGDFWDFCDVPACTGVTLPGPFSSKNIFECIDSSYGFTYAGRRSTTGNGRTCQRWDSQHPHPHPYYLPQMFNSLTISQAVNYCRNPNNDTNGPWCFTTDPNIRFEYCNISLCSPQYSAGVEGFLAFFGVFAIHSSSLASIAGIIILAQLATGKILAYQAERQKNQPPKPPKPAKPPKEPKPKVVKTAKTKTSKKTSSVEPKIQRSAAAGLSESVSTGSPSATLDRRLYRRDPPVAHHQPQSKFSHSNAVMKAMANGDEPDVWVVGGHHDQSAGLQPIREEELQLQRDAVIDPQPPPRPRETETLERRLDFDAESMASEASLPRPLRQQQQPLRLQVAGHGHNI